MRKTWNSWRPTPHGISKDPEHYAQYLRTLEKRHWQEELENMVVEDEAMMNLGFMPHCSYDEDDEETLPEDYEQD